MQGDGPGEKEEGGLAQAAEALGADVVDQAAEDEQERRTGGRHAQDQGEEVEELADQMLGHGKV